MPAALRIIHPAPALAVTLLSAALGAILARQAGLPLDHRWVLVVLSVAGSQVFTGVTNDIADIDRDAPGRPEKPLPAGHLSVGTALWIASAGLAVQLATSWQLGALPLALGAVASASALAYNLALSRSPFSALPYLVSFGLLPAWIAAGIDVPIERVAGAVGLAAPFAVAAHLANALRDFEADADAGSRSLAQVLGRRAAHRLAIGLALAVGLCLAAVLVLVGGAGLPALGLGALGLIAVVTGAGSERRLWYALLVAAVCWTAAWALSSG